MKAPSFLLAAWALATLWAGLGVVTAQTTDPAKVAEFQTRFDQGYALEQQGDLAGARAVYDGILAEEPKARRSLLEAGRVSLLLNQPDKADAYLEQLRALEPEFPAGLELLIQANSALKRDAKVEILLKKFRDLHDSGTNPEFTATENFVREVIPLDGGERIRITQFFDYANDPHVVYIVERLDQDAKIVRQIMLSYDPDGTTAIRAKDPKLAGVEEFLLVENVIKDNHIAQVNAYQQLLALPPYAKVRAAMLAVLTQNPKPIYSQAVDPAH